MECGVKQTMAEDGESIEDKATSETTECADSKHSPDGVQTGVENAKETEENGKTKDDDKDENDYLILVG